MTRFYDTNANAYHERSFFLDPSPFLTPVLKVLPPGASLLDVGCASGRDLVWFKNKGFNVTGFEKSPGLAALARENARCEVIEGDFEVYDFARRSFDAILATGALVHIPHERLFSVVRNIRQALAANGIFYISLKKGEGEKTDNTGRIFYLWPDNDLRAQFERLGFSVIDFSSSESVMNSKDVWLGYVLQARI